MMHVAGKGEYADRCADQEEDDGGRRGCRHELQHGGRKSWLHCCSVIYPRSSIALTDLFFLHKKYYTYSGSLVF